MTRATPFCPFRGPDLPIKSDHRHRPLAAPAPAERPGDGGAADPFT